MYSPLAIARFSGRLSWKMAITTGLMDMARKPSRASSTSPSQPRAERNSSSASGDSAMVASSTRRRPSRSLSEPPVSAPTTPAASITANDTPASHSSDPSRVIRVGM